MSAALAERLAPVQDALAGLEREYRERASASGAPDANRTPARYCRAQVGRIASTAGAEAEAAVFLTEPAALMAVRSAQGRDARADRYAAPAPSCGAGAACCGRHKDGTP
jgi:hypothetical protein